MAKTKAKINDNLLAAAEAIPPKNPAPTAADKSYLRGLRRRGYTDEEIRAVARKAGFGELAPDFFVPKKKAQPIAKPELPSAALGKK